MDYFEWFQLPEGFYIDEEALRKQYLQNSRRFHPDFHSLSEAAEQAEALEKSTLNNEAYKTLKDFDSRMRYILEKHGLLGDSDTQDLPQSFLMEMMDVNEQLMELEIEADNEKLEATQQEVNQNQAALLQEIEPILKAYDSSTEQAEALQKIKVFYLKKRYLLRIKENLSKFASA